MGTKILDLIIESIHKVGIKEMARRTDLAASTISRIHSGESMPSLEIAERISEASDYNLQLQRQMQIATAPPTDFCKATWYET